MHYKKIALGAVMASLFFISAGYALASVPKDCFICSYQNLPECANAIDEPTCENMNPADGAKGDCIWRAPLWDIFGLGTCKNRFERNCSDKITAVSAHYSWWATINHQPPINADWPNDCTKKDYYYIGHSNPNECTGLFDSVSVCVAGMVDSFPEGTPLSLYFLNDGCSTFQDQDAAIAFAWQVQESLPEGFTVFVGGNQATSSITTSCSSNMTITITRDATYVTYGPCHADTPDNRCLTADQVANCIDSSNVVQTEKCCKTSAFTYASNGFTFLADKKWYQGDTCPPPPPAPQCTSNTQCATLYGPNYLCCGGVTNLNCIVGNCYDPLNTSGGGGGDADIYVPRCNSNNSCQLDGDGAACTTIGEACTYNQPPTPSCNAQGLCVAGGGGGPCSLDTDCYIPPITGPTCSFDGQCIEGGGGLSCNTDNDCSSPLTDYSQDFSSTLASLIGGFFVGFALLRVGALAALWAV